MFSGTAKPIMRSAAWRISLWATLAFACGTMVVFVFLQQFVAGDIQRRTDAWLTGEAGVLGDVAARTTTAPELQRASLVMRAQSYRRRIFAEFERVKELLLP